MQACTETDLLFTAFYIKAEEITKFNLVPIIFMYVTHTLHLSSPSTLQRSNGANFTWKRCIYIVAHVILFYNITSLAHEVRLSSQINHTYTFIIKDKNLLLNMRRVFVSKSTELRKTEENWTTKVGYLCSKIVLRENKSRII